MEIIKREKNKEIHLDRVYRMMDKGYEQRNNIKDRVCKKTLVAKQKGIE